MTGYIDHSTLPEQSKVDLDDRDSIRNELTSMVAALDSGIRDPDPLRRIEELARVCFLAGRLGWLETSPLAREAFRAKHAPTAPPVSPQTSRETP